NTHYFDIEPDKIAHYNNYGEPNWLCENRPVVVGENKSRGLKTGKSLILQGHVDVVSAEPEHMWDTDPYCPTVIDNKMYGRGICDMKSGVAAMIYAVKAINESGLELGADLQIQTVIEEECTGNGALALLERGFVADAAIIPEPTELKAISSQVGVIWLQVKVIGSGAHVERAEKAVNAINKAAYLIQIIDEYREYINTESKNNEFIEHPHPLNVNVGVIKGGDWASNVPSECTFEVRIGLYPEQDPKEVQNEIKKWILKGASKDEWLNENSPEITFYGFKAPGTIVNKDSDLMKALEEAHLTTHNEKMETKPFTATTDIRAFHEFGIPATCYGAKGENMHGINEYIDLVTLKKATQTLISLILNWCEVNE